MFGNFEEQQKMMDQKMREIKVQHASNEQEIQLTLNGSTEIENIKLDFSRLDMNSPDQLEDLLIVTVNEALEKLKMIQAEESQKMLSEMMPGGLGDLGKLFGG